MAQILASSVELRAGCDYTLRDFFAYPDFVDPYAVRSIELLTDTDAEEPMFTLPYDGTDEQFSASDMRRCAMITLHNADGKIADYYVRASRPSLTAPDRFWEFDCVKDPFACVNRGTGSRFFGTWEATQEPCPVRLPFIVSNDAMRASRSIPLPKLPDGLMVVKVSSTESVARDERNNETVRKQDTAATYYAIIDAADPSRRVPFHKFENSQQTSYFPSLDSIIKDIDRLGYNGPVYSPPRPWEEAFIYGLTPSAIQDVSISERSPLRIHSKGGFTEWGYPGNYEDIDIHEHTAWLRLSSFGSSSCEQSPVTIQLSDMEYHCGHLALRTGNDDMISEVPMESMSTDAPVSVSMQTISDLTGIYTELEINGSHIIMPEGKIPCIGSNWAEYTLAQRSYDRENMTLAIQNAKSEAVQGAIMGATNGLLTGALLGGPMGAGAGVASFGLGVAGSVLDLQRSERTARMQQSSRERMLRGSVGTAYNTGYGMEYIRKCLDGRARFQLDMPAHLTQFMFENHIKMHGYPAGGLYFMAYITMNGYIRGTAHECVENPDLAKHDLERINRELTEGVRFK